MSAVSIGLPVCEELTPEEAAEYLGVSVATLSTWRCRLTYPLSYVKVGRSVRYRKVDLDNFLSERRVLIDLAGSLDRNAVQINQVEEL